MVWVTLTRVGRQPQKAIRAQEQNVELSRVSSSLQNYTNYDPTVDEQQWNVGFVNIFLYILILLLILTANITAEI